MSAPRQNPLSGGYDQSLLAAAPVASRAAKQEGYNVDLLDESRQARGTVTPPTAPEAARSKENFVATQSPAARKVPFWRTRNGIIALCVLAIIIVGAAVGGGVGGSVHKRGSSGVVPSGNGTEGVPAGNGTGGQGLAPGEGLPATQGGTQAAAPGSGSASSSSSTPQGLEGAPTADPDAGKAGATATTTTTAVPPGLAIGPTPLSDSQNQVVR